MKKPTRYGKMEFYFIKKADMFKKLFLIFFIVSSLSASSKYILLLHSYNKGLVWSEDISKGIDDSLKVLPDYELSTEYLDNKRNKNKEYHKLIRQAYIEKFKKQKFDIVIAADNAAVQFVLKHKNELFKNTPLVFTGIEEMNPGIDVNEVLKDKISLIMEHKPLKSAIESILQVMPDLKYLYVINDKTYTSEMINKIIKEKLDSFKNRIDYKLYLDGNISQIYKDFKTLPKNSAVWFGNLYLNENEKYIPFLKVNKLLNSSPVPVFSMTDYHLGKGVIGGHLLRGYYVGYEAGKRAVEIMQGKKVDYTKPILAHTQYVYDYKVMEKYGLNTNLVPAGSIFINEPETFFEKYKVWIYRIFIISPFILFFLVLALINIYKRDKLSKQLIAENKREQVLLNNVKSAVFWIDINGYIRGHNRSFSKIFYNGKDGIGLYICDVFKPFCTVITKEKTSIDEDIEFVYNDNSFFARSKTYYDENGKNGGTVTIITDITEKKQLEINKQFIIQQSKLTEVGEMLSAIVHQWKVPLIELSVVAHKMQSYYKKDKLSKENMDGFFDTIMKQIIYMGDTIDEFRQFIKPSNKPILFDINKGINEIETILDSSLKYNNIQLEYVNNLDSSYSLFGYPNEFKQVLLNIINNAKDSIILSREFKKSGKIMILLSRNATYINLSVIDDGKGFDADSLKHLFEAFYTNKKNGDGFGLYMAKLIIENKMHGTINAFNTENGANIEILLPLNIERD